MSGPEKKKVGITGESGFIGSRLREMVREEGGMIRIPFEDTFFEKEEALRDFVRQCDGVVHLAARNRPSDHPEVYETNVRLTERLVRALEQTEAPPTVVFASSIREGEDTAYGQSKKVCRERLEAWAERSGASVTILRIPNVFGPGARPFDNSFIATFAHQLIHGQQPVVTEAREVPLIRVDSLCRQVVSLLRDTEQGRPAVVRREITPDFRMPVAEVLRTLEGFWSEYRSTGVVAVPADRNRASLREAFLCYF